MVMASVRNTTWNSAADGTLEERLYFCQNSTHQLVQLIRDDVQNSIGGRYAAYGTPFGLPRGDADGDGDLDSADHTSIQSLIDQSKYAVRADIDLDGDVDVDDKINGFNNNGGYHVLGQTSEEGGTGLRVAGAGYDWDQAISTYHVRNRVLDPISGGGQEENHSGMSME